MSVCQSEVAGSNPVYRSMNRSDEKPTPPTTDYLGNEIVPGKRVAFNLSGYVRLGIIECLAHNDYRKGSEAWPSGFWWNRIFELHIKDSETGKISKIKNPGSFVIIE